MGALCSAGKSNLSVDKDARQRDGNAVAFKLHSHCGGYNAERMSSHCELNETK